MEGRLHFAMVGVSVSSGVLCMACLRIAVAPLRPVRQAGGRPPLLYEGGGKPGAMHERRGPFRAAAASAAAPRLLRPLPIGSLARVVAAAASPVSGGSFGSSGGGAFDGPRSPSAVAAATASAAAAEEGAASAAAPPRGGKWRGDRSRHARMPIVETLLASAEANYAPFHFPGHKVGETGGGSGGRILYGP